LANKPKTNNKGDKQKVSMMDVCQTPPHAIEPLLPYLPKDVTIWESASGPEELLVNALANKGYTIHATDLMYGEVYNRFTYKHGLIKWIEVTNVPFSIKYDWIKAAFENGMPFALLVPYETTFAADFMNLAKIYHWNPWPIEVLSPERRINFKMPNMGWGIEVWDEKKGKMVKKGDSAQMPTMWLTWGLNVYQHRMEQFLTYQVPMQSVKYDSDNNPIERKTNGRRTKKKAR
jgi:hypothetical protein